MNNKDAIKLIHARLVSIRALCDDPSFVIPSKFDEGIFFAYYDTILDILGDVVNTPSCPAHHAEIAVKDGAESYALPAPVLETIHPERYGYGKPNC